MEKYETLFNIVTVIAFSFVMAQIVNMCQKSHEDSKAKKREILRKLHLAAIYGDKVAADDWDSKKSK
jgi:hypothetical protein